MVNENDIANNEKLKSETKKTIIDYILLSGQTISDDSKLKLICDALELDYDEEKEKIEEQGPYTDLNQLSDDLLNNTDGDLDE